MEWKELVGKVAPVLGTALGGPLGGVAGKFLSDALGVDEENLESTVMEADTETLAKIKGLENEFKIEMKKLGIQEEQLHTNDRGSAREMAYKTTLLPQAIISSIFISGFIIVLYLVFKGDISLEGSMKDAALYLLGILSAGITQVLNFFFGSSSGSKEKTTILGKK